MASVLPELRPANWSSEEVLQYETALEGAGQVIGYCAAQLARGGDLTWRHRQHEWSVRRRNLTPSSVRETAAIHTEAEDLLADPLPEHASTSSENRRVFRERILPDELTGTPQDNPIVVFVAGQPGDGKATVTALVRDLLRHRGDPVVIAQDRYEPHHPDFYRPITEAPGPYSSLVGRRWTTNAIDHARTHRYDVIVETLLLDPADFEQPAQSFKQAGYQVEVAIVAAPEALTHFGTLDRHLRALEAYGSGRLADPALHDTAYEGALRAADSIDSDDYADLIAVLRPTGELLRGTRRTDPHDPLTAEAITAERTRPWTIPESRRFLAAVDAFERRGLSAPIPWVRQATVEGARTVTALARPHLHPDVITLHRATAGVPVLDQSDLGEREL
ncbi:zeta toxin family protein [Kribbella sp. NPDC051770]|uniref:zeta toxin family protein n=1 Tax=Kribbella sp. NPDC051770 TaxID=3155413 RepID=UPI00342696DC